MPRRRRQRLLFTAVALTFALFGCGGEGVDAPHTPTGLEDGECPSVRSMTDRTQAALDDDALVSLAPYVNDILVDNGGLRVWVPFGMHVMRQVPPAQLLSVAEGFEEGRGLARMSPHLVQVLQYTDGSSLYAEGQHYGPLDAFHGVVNECAPLTTLGVARRILEMEIEDDGQVVPYIEPLFDALVDVADDPFFRDLLLRVEFDGETGGGNGGDIRVGRDAFRLLAHLVATNIAADNFDLTYVRDLIDTVLSSQLGDEAARQKLARVLDLLELLVDEDADVFPYVQDFMGCLNDVDADGEIPGLLYDYLSIRELNYVEFLQDINAMGNEAAGVNLRLTYVDTLRAMEAEPQLSGDALRILGRFISPEVSRSTIPATLGIRGKGIATELLLFARTSTRGCGE